MVAVGDLMFVLGLLVTAHCAMRARDPELEEEESQGPDHGGWSRGTGVIPGPPDLRQAPYGYRQEDRLPKPHGSGYREDQGRHQGQPQLGLSEEAAPQAGEGGHHPARTKNWCSFVHRRVVTTAVACGMEKHTIKSQSPCPNGVPDCHLVMYKLSTRPVYREKQKIVTALLWRCCPGHGGENCEENASDDQARDDLRHKGRPHPGSEATESRTGLQDGGDLDRTQNDFQGPSELFYDNSAPPSNHTDVEGDVLHHASQDQAPSAVYSHPQHPDPQHPHQPQYPNPHQHPDPQHTKLPHHPNPQQPHPDPHQPDQKHIYNFGSPITEEVEHGPMPYPEATSALPVPHMLALIMSQLQPLLEGFNSSLERLTQQVGGLSQDVAQLKISRWGADAEEDALRSPGPTGDFEAKLDEVFLHIDEVKRQLDSHRQEMAESLHAQQVILHANLTTFKMDVDMKLKRNHKGLQMSLQSMRTEQELLAEATHRELAGQEQAHRLPTPQTPQPLQPMQPQDNPLVWEAIGLLKAAVFNATTRLEAVEGDLEVADENVAALTAGFRGLDEKIGQTGRRSQIQFMETGLEVEAARDAVLIRVEELATNLTLRSQQLQEMEVDVDYLYTLFYKNASATTECDCHATRALVSHLEQGLANVSRQARENRQALEGAAEAGADLWEDVGGWEAPLEALRQGLQQLGDSVTQERQASGALRGNVTRLGLWFLGIQEDMLALREGGAQWDTEIRRLSGSFRSLLNDAVHHADVLEALLGEEVLEFLERPTHDREAHSVPALRERIGRVQEQLDSHGLSLAALLLGTGEAVSAAADQPIDGAERRSGGLGRERQRLDPGERRPTDHADGKDLWTLKKEVEALGDKVRELEQGRCPGSSCPQAPSGGTDAALHTEVARLKRGLEEHLRVFKNVFSNTDGLEGSESTLDLNKLWAILKQKDSKRERNKRLEDKKGSRDGAGRRSRRYTSAHDSMSPSKIEDKSLVMMAHSLDAQPNPGPMIFQKSQTLHGSSYSHWTGVFTAPEEGMYLFVLTLELEPGPVEVGFSRASGAFTLLHRGGEVAEGEPPVTTTSTLRLLQLWKGEELQLALRKGALAPSADSAMAGFLLQRTT